MGTVCQEIPVNKKQAATYIRINVYKIHTTSLYVHSISFWEFNIETPTKNLNLSTFKNYKI